MNKLSAQIIKSGALVGTLDISASFFYYFLKTGDSNVFHVLKYVASGLFGKDASLGEGVLMTAGLLLHYLIAFSFTLFFFWLFPKLKGAATSRLLTGISYGTFIWTVMNVVVVPLSRIGHRPFNPLNSFINALILIVCIGIPLSYMASAFHSKVHPQPAPTAS